VSEKVLPCSSSSSCGPAMKLRKLDELHFEEPLCPHNCIITIQGDSQNFTGAFWAHSIGQNKEKNVIPSLKTLRFLSVRHLYFLRNYSFLKNV
jgi:hypothetical protein